MSGAEASGLCTMCETRIEKAECGYFITQTDGLGNESRIFIAYYATQAFLDAYCAVTGERGPTF